MLLSRLVTKLVFTIAPFSYSILQSVMMYPPRLNVSFVIIVNAGANKKNLILLSEYHLQICDNIENGGLSITTQSTGYSVV